MRMWSLLWAANSNDAVTDNYLFFHLLACLKETGARWNMEGMDGDTSSNQGAILNVRKTGMSMGSRGVAS